MDEDAKNLIERVTRIEMTQKYLEDKLDKSLAEWQATLEQLATDSRNRTEKLQATLEEIQIGLKAVQNLTLSAKGMAGGVVLTVSTLGAFIWYVLTQLGFSLTAFFTKGTH